MTTVSVLDGNVLRCWMIPNSGGATDGGCTEVMLYHNTLTGARSVTVNGREVDALTGTSAVASGLTHLPFSLRGKPGNIMINGTATTFTYTCTFDEQLVLEENQKLANVPSELPITVTIPDTIVGHDVSGEDIVWYRVVSVRRSDGRRVSVHRRFRDFFGVHEQIRAAYKGTQLLSMVPAPPQREFKLFADHFAPSFVEARRRSLEQYLTKLMSVPRAASLQDLLGLLGILPTTRETSLMFPEGPLGLTIHDMNGSTCIADFKTNSDGTPGVAEASGLVAVGDRVSRVNGEDVLGDSYGEVVTKVKLAKRPLMLHFLGYYPTVALPSGAATGGAESKSDDAIGTFGGAGGYASGYASSSAPAPAPAPATSAPNPFADDDDDIDTSML